MKPLFFLGVLAAFSRPMLAQDAPEMPALPPTEMAPTARLFNADETALARLPALLAGRAPGGVSLRVTLAQMDANPAARDALVNWVRRGGAVFLHSDAASLFGYTTTPARLATQRQAGQIYGRARAALGPGAHPLLMPDATSNAMTMGAAFDPSRMPGVNVVFYQLGLDDALVVRHPNATPLLQVTDLATNSATPLYAAALAPFGAGWAVFTPDNIDTRRADGALFLRNLMRLLPGSATEKPWASVSAANLERASAPNGDLAPLTSDLTRGMGAPALPAIGTEGATPKAMPSVDNTSGGARLLLTAGEAATLAGLIRAPSPTGTAALQVLRARLEWQRGDAEKARAWLDAAGQNGGSEGAQLRGFVEAGTGLVLNQPSADRAAALARAAENFDLAATSNPIFGPAMPAGGMGGAIAAPRVDWAGRARRAAAIFRLEPPVVTQIGVGEAAITLRSFDDDPSLRLILPTMQVLATTNNLGWRADREEILLFPSPQLFLAHRQVAGMAGPSVPLPAGSLGDVVGTRISLIALPTAPIFRTNPVTNRLALINNGSVNANVLARLHSFALLNSLLENTRAPEWMRLGVESLLNIAVNQGESVSLRDTLAAYIGNNTLLGPEGFRSNNPQGTTIAEVQAASLLNYFYRQFGAGSVVETFQLIGLGQAPDEALQSTTEMNQANFFQAWRAAELGAG